MSLPREVAGKSQRFSTSTIVRQVQIIQLRLKKSQPVSAKAASEVRFSSSGATHTHTWMLIEMGGSVDRDMEKAG